MPSALGAKEPIHLELILPQKAQAVELSDKETERDGMTVAH